MRRTVVGGNLLQLGFEGGEVVGGELDALVAGVDGERDAEVGGAAGIVGIVVVAAFHLQHVGEGALEDRVWTCAGSGSALDWVPARR